MSDSFATDTFVAYCAQTDQQRADNEPLVIGGRFFLYDEEAHQMVETDDRGVPLEDDFGHTSSHEPGFNPGSQF